MQDTLLLRLEERKRLLSEKIKARMQSGEQISEWLLGQYSAASTAYELAREKRIELEVERARPFLVLRVRLSVEDCQTIKEAARQQGRPAANLARTILGQWAIRKREDDNKGR
jgi:hypothetical protein